MTSSPPAADAITCRVQTLTDSKDVEVEGKERTLGALRAAVQNAFDIPPFEQRLDLKLPSGSFTTLKGEDYIKLPCEGAADGLEIVLTRVRDPRYKTEKETAFIDALVAGQYDKAKEVLVSSGAKIDPNCRHSQRISESVAVTEVPFAYVHPALTVAVQAGLEKCIGFWNPKPAELAAWMAREDDVCEIVRLLLEMEADINASGDEQQDCESAGCPEVAGKTPLCAAVQRGSPKLVRMLLDAKADPDAHHTYQQSAWGADRRNPFGPGEMRPESWLGTPCNGSVDPGPKQCRRGQYHDEILGMLRAAGAAGPPAPA